jgi:hypothetical protein
MVRFTQRIRRGESGGIMSTSITCPGCGFAFQVPDGADLASVSCTFCGAAVARPAARRPEPAPAPLPPPAAPPRRRPAPAPQPAAAPATPPRTARAAEPRRAPPPPPPPDDDEDEDNYRLAGTQEEDNEPYPVFTDAPPRPCPSCGKPLARRAAACTHCGLDLSSGEKVVRTYEPIKKEWEAGWPYQRRLQTFVVLQAINGVTFLFSLIVRGDAPTTFFGLLMVVALEAFLLGTYPRVNLTRNSKGKVQITKTWRICFVERPTDTIRWREHEGVVTGRSHEFSVLDWWMVLVLLPFCVFPAVLWWWFVIHPDKFHVALSKDRGYPETMLFQGQSQAMAEEIADAVSNAAALPLSRG